MGKTGRLAGDDAALHRDPLGIGPFLSGGENAEYLFADLQIGTGLADDTGEIPPEDVWEPFDGAAVVPAGADFPVGRIDRGRMNVHADHSGTAYGIRPVAKGENLGTALSLKVDRLHRVLIPVPARQSRSPAPCRRL